ncbi:LacI family DNA-binding transcriptional regulator [Aurantibacter crassamenti]|nr:LacI family DNA-binding transcriptional regulator [Aurantibacter crassamenti]
MEKKYTIKDIAELAGVSKGTVDRVLHNRGRVSKDAKERVNKVVTDIDYQPNLIARSLKNNKVYRISALIPDATLDSYWLPTVKGVDEAVQEFKPFGLVLDKYYFNPKKVKSFQEQVELVVQSKPDAILLAPVFHKESLKIFQYCKQNKIQVASFNNHIDNLSLEHFIGQDLNQSGRVAASLIDKVTDKDSRIAVIHIDEETHMRHKEIGFRDYFKEKYKDSKKIVSYSINNKKSINLNDEISLFMASHEAISAVFVTNSKAYLIVDILKKENKKIVIVGYDLLKDNIRFLKRGQIEFLIHQKPYQQAYLGVSYLAENLLFGKNIPEKKLLPIDIITAENVKYYSS